MRISTSDGISEAIGYLIVLGLVVTGISLVTLYGYPMMVQQQSLTNLRNMEQTAVVIQNDIKALTYTLDNFKETDFQVGGGSLTIYPANKMPQNFTVTAGGQTIGPFSLGEIRYFSTDENVVVSYENGMVLEKYNGQNAITLANPRWYWVPNPDGTKTMVINLVKLVSGNSVSIGGGPGGLRSQYVSATVQSIINPQVSSISIRYGSDDKNLTPKGYAQAWRTYLTDSAGLMMTENPVGSGIYQVCPLSGACTPAPNGVSSVIVKIYTIDVEM